MPEEGVALGVPLIHKRCLAEKGPAMSVLGLLVHRSPLPVPTSALHYHREPTYWEALAEDCRAEGMEKLLGAFLTFLWADTWISLVASAPICPELQ